MPETMTVETVPIASLNPDPSNVRAHDARNIEGIKGSLAKFGQRKPIVVGADNVVQAGNATLDAARSLGWDRIEIVRSPLTGVEAVAYGIADNRLSELASWDGQLAEALASLQKDESFDHLVAGFTDAEIDKLVGCATEPDTSAKLGNLEYRLIVDCVNEEHQGELLAQFEKEGLTCRALIS